MDLPFDIILYIFKFLEDNEVVSSSSTCVHWRESLSDQLWRARLSRPSNDYTKLISSQLSTYDNNWMELCLNMNGVLKNSMGLIRKAQETSSTDFDQVLTHTILNNRYYWSSRLSYNEESSEHVIYKLFKPICVVTSVMIHAYQATWQRGAPVYAPKFVKISVGFTPQKMHFVSQTFPLANVPTGQLLRLGEPQFGKYVRLDLIGRQQRQPGNDAWYTALQHVNIVGTNSKCLENRPVLLQAIKDYAEAQS